MKIDFWTQANMGQFWNYVKMLLSTVSPGVMLVVAVLAVGLLLGIVVRAFHDSSKKDDDQDEVEIRHY